MKGKYKRINSFAIPLFLNNITALIIGLCDAAIVGRVSTEAFASVTLIANTINSIVGVLGSVSLALNIIGAKLKGKNDEKQLKENMTFHIVLDLIIGIVSFILIVMFSKIFLKNIYHLTDQILKEGIRYLIIFSLSIIINLLLFTNSAYLKIKEKTKYILIGNLTASIINVVLDYILVFGKFGMPKLGMIGNAIGSVIALLVNLLIYAIVIKKEYLIKINKNKFIEIFKETKRISWPIMAQEFLESTLIITIMNSIISSIGLLQVSIYNMVNSIIQIVLMVMYAYGQTSLNFISEDLGKNDIENLKRIPKECEFMALVFYMVFGCIFIIYRRYLASLLSNDTILILEVIRYIPMVIVINIFNLINTILKYSLQAIGKSKWVFNIYLLLNMILFIGVFISIRLIGNKIIFVYIGLFIYYVILSMVFKKKYYKSLEEVA